MTCAVDSSPPQLCDTGQVAKSNIQEQEADEAQICAECGATCVMKKMRKFVMTHGNFEDEK